jgi:iron(III) transport system substrate-binding protein
MGRAVPARTTPTRRRARRKGPVGLAMLLVAGLVAALGPAIAAGASSNLAGQTIVLYSAQHEQTTQAIVNAFTQQTGIKVRIDANDEDVLTAQIEQEGSRSPADVVYTENSNWLQQLDNKGLLSKVASSTLANVPKQDSAPNGDWVGVSARISALIYNPSKISASQLPKSILDMAKPRYKGEFELAPSETDFWPVVASVAKAKGNAATLTWLRAIGANASDVNVPDNETLSSDVSQGTTDFALINHYYFYRLEAEEGKQSVHAKLAYFAPKDPGYVEDISGAAVLKSSKHPAAAQSLLAFMTAKAGQTVLAHGESFEYPIKKGVAANAEMPPLTSYKPTNFTPAELGTGLGAKKLLQQAGLL